MPDANSLVAPLAAGPLDVVGDIHGEIDALNSLLDQLGYSEHGEHPEGRRLVFVGDLVDRGPDSPAVLHRVRDLVEAGRAQCILGNHELNLLRNDDKHGNSWWTNPDQDTEHPAARISPAEKDELIPFLEGLPLALQRDDLRIVHACWHAPSIARILEKGGPNLRVADLYEHYQYEITQKMARERIMSDLKKEWVRVAPRLDDPDWEAELMPYKAYVDERVQMDNPVAVLTSGEERVTSKPFMAGGKWRMLDRIKWWDEYTDDVPVIIGHYWRRYSNSAIALNDKYGPDLFAGIEPHHWLGKKRNVYCVDFSVGARATQRAAQQDLNACKLAALRVPEWEVVHDDGERALLE